MKRTVGIPTQAVIEAISPAVLADAPLSIISAGAHPDQVKKKKSSKRKSPVIFHRFRFESIWRNGTLFSLANSVSVAQGAGSLTTIHQTIAATTGGMLQKKKNIFNFTFTSCIHFSKNFHFNMIPTTGLNLD